MQSSLARFDSPTASVLLDLSGGAPHILHWGQPLGDASANPVPAAVWWPLPEGGFDALAPLAVLPEASLAFPGVPGISGHRPDGSGWSPRMAPTDTAVSASDITVTSNDAQAGLQQTVELEWDNDASVLSVRASVTNVLNQPYNLDMVSLTVPLPGTAREVLRLGGRWSSEFRPERVDWNSGTVVIENRSGRTSPHRFPALFAGSRGFSEEQGHVWAAHLAWSGNAFMRAEVLRDGRRVLQAGELLLPGEVVLAEGESYQTPWLHLTCSTTGLNGISDGFHTYLRNRPTHPTTPRPVLLNTWEAVYFDHNLDTLKALADTAAVIGAERFVLDDGWFRGRRNDKAGLGDWFVDTDLWPNGLDPIISHVTSLGMEFGLWFEPEMVNPNSDVYRDHPDWVLHTPDMEPVLFRNQLVLDLANPDCWEYLRSCIHTILSDHNISYVKWDMNRDLVAPTHNLRATVRQQVLAVYALMDTLGAAHPNVEIESCSSGGARADFEVLRRTQRIWTSDCNDALDRQRIQRGFSYLFPPEIMGSHIGPPTAHTTGRTHGLGFRAATAFFGHLGIEWNVLKTSDVDLQALTTAIAAHKRHRPLLHSGRALRFDHPDPAVVAHGVISHNQDEAVLCLAQIATADAIAVSPLQITGLDPAATYEVQVLDLGTPAPRAKAKQQPSWTTNGIALTGQQLAAVGIQPPILHPETALLLHLVRK